MLKNKLNEDENNIRYYYDKLRNCNPISKKEEKKLFHKYRQNKDFDARNKIINSNLRFVFSEAKKFSGYGVSLPELISEGNYGLIKAIDKYDPKRDNGLLSYAVWWIRQSMQEKIKKERLIVSTKSIINDDTLDVDDNENIIKDPLLYNQDNEIFNLIDTNHNHFKTGETEYKNVIRKILNELNEREKMIITYYFGLDGSEPMNLEEIGEELNISKERVRQIKEKTMKKMRSIVLLNNIDYNS